MKVSSRIVWPMVTAACSLILSARVMAQGPLNPIGVYELDWENPADQNIPPISSTRSAPPFWSSREYVIRPNGESQVTLASNPVRAGRHSVRFELRKDDPQPLSGGRRAELSAAEKTGAQEPYEPPLAERWYGFSIYLPDAWMPDEAKEIVTQWHQDWREPTGGSPPLAILTHNDRWKVSLKDWQSQANNTVDIDAGACQKNQWTDWVVHVVWRPDATGVLEVWKNGTKVEGLPNGGKGQNTYRGWGNLIKIGIYKWNWSLNGPSSRVMYHDELRVADGATGSYAAVAPAVDGKTRLLWTHADERASVWILSSSGTLEAGSEYGPFPGWSAKAISVGSDNKTWLLWSHVGGMVSLWHLSPQGQFESDFGYGPFAGWVVKEAQ